MSDPSLSSLKFDDIVPVPHRVAALFQLGVFLWYALVWISYHVFRINILALLNLAYSTHRYSEDGNDTQVITGQMATVTSAELGENVILMSGIRKTVAKTFTLTSAGLIAYWTCHIVLPGTSIADFTATTLPLILLVVCLFITFRRADSLGQSRLNSSLKRVLLGGINSATMRTNDILISDTLTSYSKVINDLASHSWVMLMPADVSYNNKIEALVLSLPALIRIKQCWYEYRITGQRPHLLNLIKYSASLGPVFVNLLIKITMESLPDAEGSQRLNELNRWWYALSAFSSTYSFIWDIKMDWGFEAFDFLFGSDAGNTVLLRGPNKLVYNSLFGYYSVIIFDFAIRFIWVLKVFVIKKTEIELGLKNHVGNFLFGYNYLSFGYAVLELLEIVRRWLWCFIKLESDLIKLQLKDEFARAMPLSNLKLN